MDRKSEGKFRGTVQMSVVVMPCIVFLVTWIESHVVFVTAIATIVLAVLTFYYAYSTHKMLEETRKNSKQPQIFELTSYIHKTLMPGIEKSLDRANRLIDGNNLSEIWFNFYKLEDQESDAYFLSQIRNEIRIWSKLALGSKIRKYKNIVEELEKYNKKIDDLCGGDFKKYYMDLVGDNECAASGSSEIEKCFNKAKEYLRENKSEIAPDECKEFLEKHISNILKFRNEESMQETISDIKKRGRTAEDIINKLKSAFENIKEDFLRKYYIPRSKLN